MKRILKVLEKELKQNKEDYKKLNYFYKNEQEKNIKLQHQVDMLRKDLQELSQEHFKSNS
jgi:hypothetical protein